MLATIVICFAALLLFGMALAVGQFFGRKPIAPKCNPDTCCMRGDDCDRRSSSTSGRS